MWPLIYNLINEKAKRSGAVRLLTKHLLQDQQGNWRRIANLQERRGPQAIQTGYHRPALFSQKGKKYTIKKS